MNSPIEQPDGDPDLRYAEYVLGVLDAEARAAVAHEIASSAEAATAVAQWERKLLPLAEQVPPVPPAAHVWQRIASATEDSAVSRPRSPGQRTGAPLWRAIALGASALAAALLLFVVLRPGPRLTSPTYLASTIQADNGAALWTATLDRPHARLIVVPATPTPLPPDRAPELWVIPAGGKPVALGMIASGQPVTLTLTAAVLAQVGTNAKLAVSIEPPTGSPTGQPTGPVIGAGAVRDVPAS